MFWWVTVVVPAAVIPRMKEDRQGVHHHAPFCSRILDIWILTSPPNQ